MGLHKGQTNNKKGRPLQAAVEDLRKALAMVEKEKKISFLEDFVRKAFEDKSYAQTLIGKLVPDLKHIEGNVDTVVNLIVQNYAQKRADADR